VHQLFKRNHSLEMINTMHTTLNKLKVKCPEIYVPLLTRKPEQQRLQCKVTYWPVLSVGMWVTRTTGPDSIQPDPTRGWTRPVSNSGQTDFYNVDYIDLTVTDFS